MPYANVLLLRCSRFYTLFTAEAPGALPIAGFNATAAPGDRVNPSSAS